MTVKHPMEARGHFIVGMAPDIVEGEKVVKAKPYKITPYLSYNYQTVVGVKAFEGEIEKERQRVIPMPKKFGGPGRGYEDEPGAREVDEHGVPKYKKAIAKVINERSKDPYRCVTDLIDYTIESTRKVYRGTVMEDKFMIYGDALSSWGEAEAQQYIAQKYPGMEKRFILPVGTSKVGTTANRFGPPGDSPEHCALDCNLFADLKSSMVLNATVASVFPMGDARRIFGQGTPEQVAHLMKETWEHCAPTLPRIEEDILRLEGHLKLIVAANGCMVPDIELKRHGRREVRIDGKIEDGELRKTKARKRDRKATLPGDIMLHPSLGDAEKHFFGTAE